MLVFRIACTLHARNFLALLATIASLLLPQPATAVTASMALGYECTPEGSALSTSARRPVRQWQAKPLYGEAKQEPSCSCTPASSTPLNPRFFPSNVPSSPARRKARPEAPLQAWRKARKTEARLTSTRPEDCVQHETKSGGESPLGSPRGGNPTHKTRADS